MEAAVEAGEANSYNLARLTDIYLVAVRRPQLYGMEYWRNEERDVIYYPIEDGVEERRAALGLESFEALIRRTGDPWPVPTGWPPE